MWIHSFSSDFLYLRYFRSNLRRNFAFGLHQRRFIVATKFCVRDIDVVVVIDPECTTIGTAFEKQVLFVQLYRTLFIMFML